MKFVPGFIKRAAENAFKGYRDYSMNAASNKFEQGFSNEKHQNNSSKFNSASPTTKIPAHEYKNHLERWMAKEAEFAKLLKKERFKSPGNITHTPGTEVNFQPVMRSKEKIDEIKEESKGVKS
jgi:hypothetical protein